MEDNNPYQAPLSNVPSGQNSFDYEPIETYEDQGSYGLGIAVGLIFALLGLIIIYIMGAEQTKKGALHGFLIRIGLTVLFVLAAVTMS